MHRCPNPECRQAFVDFTDCFAVTCSRCRVFFCAFCIAFTSADNGKCHDHVRECAANTTNKGSYWGTPADFAASNRRREERLLREYVATLSGEVARAVTQGLRRVLTEHGLAHLIRE